MSDKTSLGDRMKEYENVTRFHIQRRTPTIIRVDGRAFHTFTRKIKAGPDSSVRSDTAKSHSEVYDVSLFDTPFSVKLHHVMMATTSTLLSQIQNAAFAYTQSDEISILLRDWDRNETQQWFGATLQKMCSISAAIATASFNAHFNYEFNYEPLNVADLATFDSRVFNLPVDEVNNYFIWRQQDASRNSVQMYGRHFFSQKQMHGKSNEEIQNLLLAVEDKNWNDLPTWMRRGSCIYNTPTGLNFDVDIPIFTKDRHFVEQHLTPPSPDLEEILQEAKEELSE
jgi:tRNA(His) 5'-end guanylyltransferase